MRKSGPHLPPSKGPIVCQTRVQSGEPTGPALSQASHCSAHAAVDKGRPNCLSQEAGRLHGRGGSQLGLKVRVGLTRLRKGGFLPGKEHRCVGKSGVLTGQVGAAGREHVWVARVALTVPPHSSVLSHWVAFPVDVVCQQGVPCQADWGLLERENWAGETLGRR